METERIAVIGAGAWGTALANLLAKKGYEVTLWARKASVAREIGLKRENKRRLPGFRLSENLKATASLEKAVYRKEIIFLAVPTAYFRSILKNLKIYLLGREKRTILVNCSKGMEVWNGRLPHQITEEVLAGGINFDYLALSGPNFAQEVAAELPAATTLASENQETAQFVQKLLQTPYFRPYTNDDISGVELCGALKNVIAIAAGICEGLKLGNNAKASLVDRGLREIKKLGEVLGAKPETFSGLAGIGDLVNTCYGELSRNRKLGFILARDKKSLKEALREIQGVAEGIGTSKAIFSLASEFKTEIPICEEVYKILFKNKDPKRALESLMNRRPKMEFESQ